MASKWATDSVQDFKSRILQLRESAVSVTKIADLVACSERTVRRLQESKGRSEQRILEFEHDWRSGKAPRVEDYLPPQGNPTREEFLEELIKVDLEYWWRSHEASDPDPQQAEPPILDHYVRRFPELGLLRNLPIELILEEFRVRTRWGDQPAIRDYQKRFPGQKKKILSIELDRIHSEIVADQNLDQDDDEEIPPMASGKENLHDTRAPEQSSGWSAVRNKPENPAATQTEAIAGSSHSTRLSSSEKYTSLKSPKKGGFAFVWKATDSILNREVAYKELRPDRASDSQYRNMFLHEAQVTAQLEHPNIVTVYELGETSDGERPYYTMKYMHGETLRQVIAEFHRRRDDGAFDSLGLRRLLDNFLKLCNAVNFAHSRGVIHRDLKPDNVIVESYGEVVLLDWGLAKFIGDSETDLPVIKLQGISVDSTKAGARLGTPAYWAPEQAKGQLELIDFRTDIYGLGATLFEILTGRAPHAHYDEEGPSEIPEDEPLHARDAESKVPASLDAICAKALEPKRSNRYSKVSELVSDIERWLADEPVTAYPERLPEKFSRVVRRNRIPTMVAFSGLVTVFVVFAFLYHSQKLDHAKIVHDQLKQLDKFSNEQVLRLTSDIDNLREDVSFLANLDLVHEVLRMQNNHVTDPTPGEGGKPDTSTSLADPRQRLGRVFEEFLNQKPNYMQLRVLGENGMELVRVERTRPNGKPITIDPFHSGLLQNKSQKDYFTKAMKEDRGKWYLSSIDLNEDHGEKQKDLPVIRGVSPVFFPLSEKKSPTRAPSGSPTVKPQNTRSIKYQTLPKGIVVINLHFRELVENFKDFESSPFHLVYLTDEQGRFLYHRNSDIAFSFERNLDYRIDQLYPHLNYASFGTAKVAESCIPQPAVMIRPEVFTRVKSDKVALYSQFKDRMNEALLQLQRKNPNLRYTLSDEADAVIYGMNRADLHQLAKEVESTHGVRVSEQKLPSEFATTPQVVHFTKLELDLGDEKRFLGLALVLSHEAYDQERTATGLFFVPFGLLIVVVIATYLSYRMQRTGPR